MSPKVKNAEITFNIDIQSVFKKHSDFHQYIQHIVDENGESIPMDFVRVRRKLRDNEYQNIAEYHMDMQRIWANRYEPPAPRL